MGFAPKVRFAPDSPLEGTGFEPSVPRQEKWSMPSSSDQTRVGRTLTLGRGAESSLEGRDIELSVSPKDICTSPYDLCANRSDRRQSRRGTDGSNPLPSSGESPANRVERPESWSFSLGDCAELVTMARDFRALHAEPERRDLAWRYGIGPD